MPAEVETKKAGEAKEEPQDETQDLKLKIEHEADEKVVVHPLVLLSVVDHYNRMRKVGHSKRVVGVLLGSWGKGEGGQGRVLDVSNSFAVPFDEDEKDDEIWFLDHEYLDNMYVMFKKVNAKEKVVGWYHTGPKLHKNDMKINDLIRDFCSPPDHRSVLVIVDAKPKHIGLPTEAYKAVEEVHVEHLLRDIKDTTVGTLSQRITNQLMGLKGLNIKLNEMKGYLTQVIEGRLPMNHQIMYHLQDIFNLLPDLTDPNFVKSVNVNTNDQMLVVYTASLIRSIIALHNLINNKITNKDAEKKEAAKKEEAKNKSNEAKEKENNDKNKSEDDSKKEESKKS